jgi:hypothetical protein
MSGRRRLSHVTKHYGPNEPAGQTNAESIPCAFEESRRTSIDEESGWREPFPFCRKWARGESTASLGQTDPRTRRSSARRSSRVYGLWRNPTAPRAATHSGVREVPVVTITGVAAAAVPLS